MQLAFVINIVIAVASKGTGGQEIFLNHPTLLSPCEQGLRSGVDSMYIRGTVGKDFNSLVKAGWSDKVAIELLPLTSEAFLVVCVFSIGFNGVSCGRSNDQCYCDNFDASAGTADIFVEFPAETSHSQGTIRAAWLHINGTKVVSSNITLPLVYDVTSAEIKMWISGLPQPLNTDGRCSLEVTLNSLVDLRVCCSKMATPCYPQIVINGSVVASNESPCVSFVWMAPESSADLTMLYSVCSNTDYILGLKCTVNIVDPSKQTSGDIDKEEDGLVIAILIVILMLITGCVIGILLEHTRECCLSMGTLPPTQTIPLEIETDRKTAPVAADKAQNKADNDYNANERRTVDPEHDQVNNTLT